MKYLVFIAIGIFGIWLGQYLARRSMSMGSLNAANQVIAERKKENLQKIIDLLERNETIQNNDVEKLLEVSDATATNYLEALEGEGKIVQIGKTGQSVYYKKTNG